MMMATQIVLLIMAGLFFLACLSSKTEKRGYLFLVSAVLTVILLLLTFKING